MERKKMKKILFLTGTRADYGKIKSLMKKVENSKKLELYIFVTGMHMLSKYGSTWKELEKDNFKNIYHFVNQKNDSHMDSAFSYTILGLSNYVNELKPDMVVVHGDRLEALAGAIVGAFNNIKVAHIEGGEVSGTIDESIRHAITKFSHVHLVSNEEAKRRIMQLGENEGNVFIIGSPDIDIMISDNLPELNDTKKRYDILFENYAILMYHPVTTEIDKLQVNIKSLVDALLESEKNYIVIYPNNDEGSKVILSEYKRFERNNHFKLYPSLRFEHFLTLLKHCDFMIGNSSAGIREAGVYGRPSIDIGNRQKHRYNVNSVNNIIHVSDSKTEILNAINKINGLNIKSTKVFGDGKSDEKFIEILEDQAIWDLEIQKSFIDVEC
ncbi:UDP-N-acetylglucosamine 2-epimerase [Aquibacillus albus]|uniref:UDP-N-acetylglucosamine 2-epimerase (Hydrolyzing) n=1 Tax=Aquibacillus albus TaxID=1168171 RepID=A0ABS2N4Y2_9BACI|nr:UDP-N-acetylglucosamine 2-epimerase [Aquibacillus albus]MBM7573192.1 UDP-N-acetylglucosamine 2-epimerase (hydrolyzing) [Aquibacillus albus]